MHPALQASGPCPGVSQLGTAGVHTTAAVQRAAQVQRQRPPPALLCGVGGHVRQLDLTVTAPFEEDDDEDDENQEEAVATAAACAVACCAAGRLEDLELSTSEAWLRLGGWAAALRGLRRLSVCTWGEQYLDFKAPLAGLTTLQELHLCEWRAAARLLYCLECMRAVRSHWRRQHVHNKGFGVAADWHVASTDAAGTAFVACWLVLAPADSAVPVCPPPAQRAVRCASCPRRAPRCPPPSPSCD